MFDSVKDSGVRQEFSTGSKRDTQVGKGRFDLLPFIALTRLAKHYENGSAKYGDHNWRKGQPLSRFYSSAMRHMFKWMLGWKDEDHLSAAVWNLCSIIETEEMIRRGKLPKELDDRYSDLLDDEQWSTSAQDTPDNEVPRIPDVAFEKGMPTGVLYEHRLPTPLPVASGILGDLSAFKVPWKEDGTNSSAGISGVADRFYTDRNTDTYPSIPKKKKRSKR